MAKRSILLTCSNSAFAFILFFTAQVNAAEWHKDYEAGASSAKKNQCADAIPKLLSSLREKPDEGIKIKFYGMNFGDYFPHFYLGKCYFQQQNYKAAIAQLEISEQQGQIQKKKDLWSQLNQMKTVAKAQMTVPSAPKTAEAQQPAPKEIPPPKIEPEPTKTKEPEPVQVIQANPSPAPASIEPVKKEPAKEVLPEPPAKPQKTPEELAQERANSLIQNAARKYFQGDYDSAIVLVGEALQAKPEDLRAEFLLGCAYAAKYLLSGTQDQNSLQKASATFQKIKKVSPNFPGRRNPYISPAILNIYEKAS